jgi:hypothetical protein
MVSRKTFAAWAGIVVVLCGGASFIVAAARNSYELTTASAAFAGAGLYLLFGKDPPARARD